MALVSVLYDYVLPFDGAVGFVLLTYATFLGLYAFLVALDEDRPTVADRLASALALSLALVLLGALVFVVGYVASKGLIALRNLNFYTEDMTNAGPLDPLGLGGIKHAIVGTLIMITIALIIVIPLGITCAVYLNEIPGRLSRFVRTIVEAMTALPSIIAGLFIYATFILILGQQKSGMAAALAISVMMLPIVIRASDVVIRLVPGSLKEASYALGSGQLRTVMHVVLPTARSGLTTAVILATARGIGETSPVLLTAGFTNALNLNPTSGPMVSLPLAAFDFIKSPEQTFKDRGFAAATVLLGLVLVLFIVARMLGGRGPGQLTKRQRRGRAKQSARDAARFDRLASTESLASPSPAAHPTTGTPT